VRRGIIRVHFAHGTDMWTLCRLWADAVTASTDIAKVNCETCLLKWDAG
jgi:hypothetical protein